MRCSWALAVAFVIACKGGGSSPSQSGTEPPPPPTPSAPPLDTAPAPAPAIDAAAAPAPVDAAKPTPAATPDAKPVRPDPKPRPKPRPDTVDISKLGTPCGAGDKCDVGTCVTYYGIAGQRGGAFKSCEITCKGGGGCPAGTECRTIADGPGQVCRAP